MKSMIEQLIRGELCHPDEAIIRNEAVRKASETILKALEDWRRRHSHSDWVELEALLELYGKRHAIEQGLSFRTGFRAGAGLMVEVLTGNGAIADQISSTRDELQA
ncbi:DUF6809 family protein [Gorillibacterium sp. CAU 1737]|uniref:DUF6809 family protein n=1 Tax=Gorillibacterium sp. CAU 1737 TaxID=3140362 RepID=UPI0032615086